MGGFHVACDHLSPERIVARYLESTQCLDWLLRNADCQLLLYEDLVSDPKSAIGAVAAALGLKLDSRRLKVAFKRDAQLGSPLARKALREKQAEPSLLASALDIWADAKPVRLLTEVGLARLR